MVDKQSLTKMWTILTLILVSSIFAIGKVLLRCAIIQFLYVTFTCNFKIGLPIESESLADNFIIGGRETTIESYPYIVSIGLAVRHHMCGGSIIHRQIILSAAHCYIKLSMNDRNRLSVRAGSSIWYEGGSRIQVENVKIHNGYDRDTKENDIALLILKASLLYSKFIQPIALPDQDVAIFSHDTLVISGWGTRHYNQNDFPQYLHSVQVLYVNQLHCQRIYRDWEPRVIDERHICAGWVGIGGRDACQV